MSEPVNISTASVPTDWCLTDWPSGWAFLVSLLSAEVAGDASFFNFGNTTPTPDNRTKPWIRTNADGTPDRTYVFVNGAWIAKHPVAAGIVVMYEGAEASIETLDGGEAGAVTATTGPMWEKVTTINGRFPIGPGTTANGTVIAVGGTGGADEVELLEENVPLHEIQGHGLEEGANLSGKFIVDDDRTAAGFLADTYGGDEDGETVPHQNLPPYLGIWFIRKTARTHYRL